MNKQQGSAHVISVVVLIVALLGALGFVFWQNFMSKDSDNVGIDQSKNKTEGKSNNPSQDSPDTSVNEAIITRKLPKDRTLSYIDNFNNNQIILLGSPLEDSDYLAISDKRVVEFLGSVNNDSLLKEVCTSSEIRLMDFAMGFYKLDKKEFRMNQYANCLYLLSDERFNSNQQIREEAKVVLSKVEKNIKSFIKESKIE